MKIINDQKITTPPQVPGEPNIKTTYFEMIKMILETLPPGQGMNIKTMRERLTALDRLDAAKNGVAELEDRDIDILHSCIETFQWGVVSKEIEKFVDYIYEIKKGT